VKDYEKLLIGVINDYADEYGIEAVLEILFPGASIGEVMNDAFNAGLIPDEDMEKFINA
jgi:hypothetical protein